MSRAKKTLADHKQEDDLLARERLTQKRIKAKKRAKGDTTKDDED